MTPTHITALLRRQAEADSLLEFGVDLVGQVSQGQTTPKLYEQAEGQLRKALERILQLNQVIPMPD